jgi:hypothetical protein
MLIIWSTVACIIRTGTIATITVLCPWYRIKPAGFIATGSSVPLQRAIRR